MLLRPKFKLREIIWLLLPVLLLGGIGWYFARQPAKPDSGEWQIVVDEVKLVPITPREVAAGYDTKVAIRAHMVGKPPVIAGYPTDMRDWPSTVRLRLTQLRGGREQVIISAGQQRDMLQTTSGMHGDGTIATAVMKLSAFPPSSEPITLKAEVQGTQHYHDYTKGRRAWIVRETAKVPISIVVRKAGQKVTVPTAPRYRPFSVENIQVGEGRWAGSAAGDIMVIVKYRYEEAESRDNPIRMWSGETYLLDEKGHKYSRFKVPTSKWPYPIGVGYRQPQASTTEDNRIGALDFEVPLSQVPQNVGKVTLHSSLSINDCWPLPISVVVRDKDGKIIKQSGPEQPPQPAATVQP